MPKRRNPITKAMIQTWIDKAKSSHPDSFIAAIADWMILGHYAGFRKAEWIQEQQVYTSNNKDLYRNNDGTVKAFIMSDFIFRGI